MDKELLTTLGLDPQKDLKGLLEDLEGKQYEFFERLETTNSEERKAELNGLLARIDAAISQIKNQLASVNSAIIFDNTGDEDKAAAAQKAEQAAKKAREAEEKARQAAQVQALKEKEEARRKQEAEAKAKAEAEAKAKAEAEAKAKAEAEAEAKAKKEAEEKAKAQQPVNDLQHALLRYQKKEFNAAFLIFKQLAEKNDATAQYMLSSMYNRGEGTAPDQERAEFWMKKSADNGDVIAQYDYAIFLLSDSSRDSKKTGIGIHYLKRSADGGHRPAMDRYVELAENGIGDLHELSVAQRYCTKLMPMTEDSYDRQKYRGARKALRQRKRQIHRRRFGAASSSLMSFIGAVILMGPAIWLFAAFHKDFLMTIPFFQNLPEAAYVALFFTHLHIPNGPVLESIVVLPALVAIGWIFKGAGNKLTRNRFSTVIVRLGVALRYIVIVGHIVLCSVREVSMLVDPVYTLGSLAVAIVGGRIIGLILGRILGTHKR